MKRITYLISLFVLVLACNKGDKANTLELFQEEIKLTKLEKLLLLPHDSLIFSYDLSNDSLSTFPDLSAYAIKTLDLSGNMLDTIIPHYLPKGLDKLNLSHNKYRGQLRILENSMHTLKELDISYNALKTIYVGEPLYRIIVSHNDLVEVDINHRHIQYLDISYNSNMSERVTFSPERIDTIIREGVADGKQLVSPNAPMIVYDFIHQSELMDMFHLQ